MWFIRLLVLFLFFIPSISVAKNKMFYFEPDISELSGTIAILTLPGPPHYSSIKNGDEAEIGAYLILAQPIDVKLASQLQKMGEAQPESEVKVIQLILNNEEDWKKMENGNQVLIRGSLFHARWAHHHARVLFNIQKITIVSKEKMDNKQLVSYLEPRQELF